MKTFVKEKEGNWSSSETSLTAEHSTRHGQVDDSPSLSLQRNRMVLSNQFPWHLPELLTAEVRAESPHSQMPSLLKCPCLRGT